MQVQSIPLVSLLGWSLLVCTRFFVRTAIITLFFGETSLACLSKGIKLNSCGWNENLVEVPTKFSGQALSYLDSPVLWAVDSLNNLVFPQLLGSGWCPFRTIWGNPSNTCNVRLSFDEWSLVFSLLWRIWSSWSSGHGSFADATSKATCWHLLIATLNVDKTKSLAWSTSTKDFASTSLVSQCHLYCSGIFNLEHANLAVDTMKHPIE